MTWVANGATTRDHRRVRQIMHQPSSFRSDLYMIRPLLANASLSLAIALFALACGPVALRAQRLVLPDSLPPGVTADMVRRGQEVFRGDGLCHTCHGPDATGEYGPNLTRPTWWHSRGSYLSIVQRVLMGVPASQSVLGIAMPARGGSTISDEDVQSVAAYVWTLSHEEAGDSLPTGVTRGMVNRGREVFLHEEGCARCHGTDASGALGPNLTDTEWLHNRGDYLAIVSRVFTGVSIERSRSGKVMPPRGGSYISEPDVYAVAAYVWVLGRRKR